MTWAFIFIMLLTVGVVSLILAYLREEKTVSDYVQFVSPAVHGAFDYLVGGLLIGGPWLLGFADGGAETWVPVALGIGIVLYSLCTDYAWGLVRRLPMPAHLVLDGVSGFVLAASPMLFGFYDEVMDPHLSIGVLEMVLALVTRPVSAARKMSSRTASDERAPTSPPWTTEVPEAERTSEERQHEESN